MKILLLALFAIVSLQHPIFAKAYFQTKQEMIAKAEAIAIIEISNTQESSTKGNTWTYRAKGTAIVTHCLKGTLPEAFILYGNETFLCASCPIQNGRFLAFLKKDGDVWSGSNWHLSLRPIQDHMVDWYVSNENRYEMKPTPLDLVLAEIKTPDAETP